jgi:hypothetical protein
VLEHKNDNTVTVVFVLSSVCVLNLFAVVF